jgi:anti-sigma factor (TIGR02949 family)
VTSQVECEEAVAKLLEFLDGELDEITRHGIERHLETCRGCFERAEFERRLRERVAQTAVVPAPESLRRRVRALMETF